MEEEKQEESTVEVKAEGQTRTVPVFWVPIARWASPAQWSPARTATSCCPSFSAISSEGVSPTLKESSGTWVSLSGRDV